MFAEAKNITHLSVMCARSFRSKSKLLVAVMVSEDEMNTAAVILSEVQYLYKRHLLVAVMVSEAEMNTAEVLLRIFLF